MNQQRKNQDNILVNRDPLNNNPMNKNPLLDLLSRVKRHTDTVPVYTPKNFYEQFVFFDDGTNQRLYVFVNGSWKYSTLT